MSKSFPSVQTCFGAFFGQKSFSHCSMEGRAFENFQKNRKNFKFQKMPLMVSQSVPTCFEQALGQFFWNCFCPMFHAVHFRFSGLKIKSSGSRNYKYEFSLPTKYTTVIFLHYRQSQCTQFPFRSSRLKIRSSDSRT